MGRKEKVKTNIGIWLENKRRSENESIEEQAKRIGIHKSSICQYSTGLREMSEKFLKKVEKAYNLQGKEKKDLYIASLTVEDVRRGTYCQDSDMDAVEMAVYIKYGVL